MVNPGIHIFSIDDPPILEARHWSIVNGEDVDAAVYHRTHSGYTVAAFHEALRILLSHGRAQMAADYEFHEKGLREASRQWVVKLPPI